MMASLVRSKPANHFWKTGILSLVCLPNVLWEPFDFWCVCEEMGEKVAKKATVERVAELPELGTFNRRQAAALAGLAPHPRESGQWHGRRSIGSGRAPIRRALYMAAHSNRQLKEFYQRLRAAGKPAKVALTAVMRKLIVLMNHLLKNPSFALQN
jgi:transposase